MESKTNYTLVGLVILILMVGLLSAILWLSVGFNQKQYSFYTVYLAESVSGLGEQSAVKFNGVQVGFVKKIQLDKHDPRKVQLTLSIEKDIPITVSTSATLISQGITGVTFIGLAANSPDLTPLPVAGGERFPVIPSRPSLFNQLDSILKQVSENINTLSEKAQRIFNEENAKNVKKTLENLEKVTEVFSHNEANINNLITSTNAFMKDMADASKSFPNVVKHVNSAAIEMSKAGKSVSGAMNTGKDTVDQFSQQTIPSANLLIQRLNAIAANLEQVSNEMKQNPAVVIRGAKPRQSGPGE